MARDWYDIVKRTQEDLESVFDNFVFFRGPISMRPEAGWRPAVDVYQTKEDVVVCIEVAGVPKEAIDVTVDGDILSISGVRKERFAGTAKRSYYKMEISFGLFERKIHLPCHCDATKASVEENSGLIRITMPKTPRPEIETTEIEIE
jgi:HSP20 family protein